MVLNSQLRAPDGMQPALGQDTAVGGLGVNPPIASDILRVPWACVPLPAPWRANAWASGRHVPRPVSALICLFSCLVLSQRPGTHTTARVRLLFWQEVKRA